MFSIILINLKLWRTWDFNIFGLNIELTCKKLKGDASNLLDPCFDSVKYSGWAESNGFIINLNRI